MSTGASRQRFLPAEMGSLGPRNDRRGFSEFVSTFWTADGRQRGRRGRRGVARSSVPTTQPPRYAPWPNGAAWGPTGRRRSARNARQGGLNHAER